MMRALELVRGDALLDLILTNNEEQNEDVKAEGPEPQLQGS